MTAPLPHPREIRPMVLPCLGLVVAAALTYVDSLSGPFIFDDLASIPQNLTLRSAATAFFPPGGGLTVSGRPVLNASLALNWFVSGHSVWSYHLLNAGIHAAAGLTLFGIVRRTFRLTGAAAGEAVWPAFLTALLWVVHPLQTESVTYVVQRAESLMGLFYLLSLYCFIRGAESGAGRSWFALSVIACLLGVGTKEVIVSVPIIAWAYDRTWISGSFAEAWRRHRRTLGALFATWIPLGALVVAGGGRGHTVGAASGVGFFQYLGTQFQAVSHYLWLVVWPHPLILDYGRQWPASAAEVVPFLLLVGILLGATVWGLLRKPAFGFLGLLFFAILAPTSLVPGGRQTLAEHRMYLALAPVLALLVTALDFWLGRWSRWLAIASALGFACATAIRNADYRTDLGIWAETVASRPGNAYAQNNYANLLSQAGHPDQALEHLETALRSDPAYPEAGYNAGVALIRLGRPAEAVARLERALAANPGMADAHTQLGAALEAIGRPSEAVAHFQAALRIDPSLAEADDRLGDVFRALGQPAKAIDAYKAALALEPHRASAHNNLGNAYRETGRLVEAMAEYDAALSGEPDSPLVLNNRGITLVMMERIPEAIQAFQAALRRDPNLGQVHVNLAIALARSGRDSEAQAELELAERLGVRPPPGT